jgi:hypothetical protein
MMPFFFLTGLDSARGNWPVIDMYFAFLKGVAPPNGTACLQSVLVKQSKIVENSEIKRRVGSDKEAYTHSKT